MVWLDRQDRVACDDEIGPLFGSQKEIAFRLEPVVGPRLDREKTVEGRDRFLSAVQLDACVGPPVQGARMAGGSGGEFCGPPVGARPPCERPGPPQPPLLCR